MDAVDGGEIQGGAPKEGLFFCDFCRICKCLVTLRILATYEVEIAKVCK